MAGHGWELLPKRLSPAHSIRWQLWMSPTASRSFPALLEDASNTTERLLVVLLVSVRSF